MSLDLASLAERYGTPLYVYDGAVLHDDLTRLRAGLHPELEIFYSLKANPNISVFAFLHRHGARAEVSSLAELRTARMAGAAPENILFLGPGKSAAELAACVREGVYAIVAESLDEVEQIDRIAAGVGRVQRVLLRINPATSPSAARLAMGGKPRQFGVDEDLVLAEAGRLRRRLRHARLGGVHVYFGTRILSAEAVAANTRYVLDLAERVTDVTGIPLEAVDIGGGLGVPYFGGEQDFDLDALGAELNPMLAEFRSAHADTRLILEAGRYVAARCGTYVVSVRTVKTSQGEMFAITDGGTHHHMAAVGIGSVVKRNFPVVPIGDDDGFRTAWHVTGPLCTPNDVIAKGVELPQLKPGDLLGVLMSGAYGPTASPGLFLGHGHPAEVLVVDGRDLLVRSRDTVDDVLSRQIHHPFDTKATP